MKITRERFKAACDDYEGFCDHCQEFTRGETESDSENYECPACGFDDVFGAEQALIMGLFEIKDQ